jgi:hypothetical protein
MILFVIAITLFLISVLGIIFTNVYCEKHNKRFGNTLVGPISVIVLVVDLIFGLALIPSIRVVKTEYAEMHNCIILKSRDAVIIDLTNSPDNWTTFENLKKFNTYKAVTEFSDSTKIFREISKSFYNFSVYNQVVWSNPPYKDFYRE